MHLFPICKIPPQCIGCFEEFVIACEALRYCTAEYHRKAHQEIHYSDELYAVIRHAERLRENKILSSCSFSEHHPFCALSEGVFL